MASSSSPPPPPSPCLNLTCGLLDVLDLNQNQSQIMDDVDIDRVVEVPDTPDRYASRHIIAGKCSQQETSSQLRNSDVMEDKQTTGFRGTDARVNENGHNRRLVISSKNLSNGGGRDRDKSSVFPSLENSHSPHNDHLFRRAAIDKRSNQEKGHSSGARVLDKGKFIRVKFPSKSSACQENGAFFDLTSQNDHSLKSVMVLQHDSSSIVGKDTRNHQRPNADMPFLNYVTDSPIQSSSAIKGTGKVDDNTFQGIGLSMVQSPRRVVGQKRLVKNGCISPHLIAMRAKQVTEQHNSMPKADEQSHSENVTSSGPSCLININDIVAEDRDIEKGKGVLRACSLQDQDARTIHGSNSHTERGNGAGDASIKAFGFSNGIGGWRSTRNRSRNIDQTLSDASAGVSKISDKFGSCVNEKHEDRMERLNIGSGKQRNIHNGRAGNSDAAPRVLRIVPKVDLTIGTSHGESTCNKRQKKQGSNLINSSECSESDIICLSSPGQSSNSRPSGIQSHRSRNILDSVIEVDEFSAEMRHPLSIDVGCSSNEDSDARARQLEADEMLARELQEQLYHEVSFVGDSEIDENIALALQQQENTLRASSGRSSRDVRHPRASLAHSNRQPRSRSSQVASNRTGTQSQTLNATRMALRSRFPSQSSRVLSRQTDLHFPLDMDLDMRLDMLEALEAAVGDINDMRVADRGFRLQRDFNEDDYEMLLALDENNHRHAGASVNRINSLPQSTVQTDNLEEACAICLETPTIGETIRHLPCLHKFHKDCIDPWLRRKTSCPVCKSSIT